MLWLVQKKLHLQIVVPKLQRNNIVWRKDRCSAGSLSNHSCTNFSTKTGAEMNYQIAKKYSEASATLVHGCKKN